MPTWSTGQAWRVVNALNKLNAQIRAYAPNSVPPATDANAWGSIADDAHSTSSDHYPHYYTALGGTAVVCARDFPHAPSLGLDGGVVTEWMRQQKDPRIQYIIFNRRITGVSYGWTWHTYTGADSHDTHFHVSTVHTGLADGSAPFSLPGGEAETQKGEPIMVFTVTNVPAGTTDILGNSVVNSSRMLVTPNGPVVLLYDEMIAYYNANGGETAFLKMSWARLVALCTKLAGPVADTAAIVSGVLQGMADDPASEVTQEDVQAVLDAIAANPAAVRAQFTTHPLS